MEQRQKLSYNKQNYENKDPQHENTHIGLKQTYILPG
jgi:hypothetical protein